MIWPNLFVVGVAKAGTTTLHSILDQHPSIKMSTIKEPHFFTRNIQFQEDQRELERLRDKDEYLALFTSEDAGILCRGESSPSYFWEEGVADRIQEVSPEAKIIVLLRDPVMRAFSHYKMDYQAERERNWSFLRALQEDQRRTVKGWGKSRLYLELGYYAEPIKRFRRLFGQNNVLILLYEEFFATPNDQVARIWEFLDLPLLDIESTPTLNKGTSGNALNKLLKRIPLKSLFPSSWKHEIQAFASSLHRSQPDRLAVDFLLEHYSEDLQELSKMGLPLYEQYALERYSFKIDSLDNGS